jgi:shikimate dehydrogenase
VAEGIRGLNGTDRRRVRAAVLGSPISHSLSPVLHTAAYAALGLSWWRYEAIECGEVGLSALLDRCGPDWAGLSLTMPLKRTVLPLLDRVEPLAADVGCANTVVFAAAQRFGYNTDVAGMVSALAEHGIDAKRQPAGSALIIGGGATACAALAALRDLGERSVTVAIRSGERAENLRAAAARLGITLALVAFDPEVLDGVRLVISTVPAGAADIFAQNFPALASPPEAVFDVVYHPWPTALATAAQRVGAVLVSGFDLLLHQAGRQVELMTDRPAPLAAMRQAGQAELATRAGKG